MTDPRDAFGDRMKGYEAASDFVLPARLPVVVRLDGNSFSKLTARFEKPYDARFVAMMDAAAAAVVQYSAGRFAYVQSDEITLVLRNDRNHGDTPILGNRIQKLASLLAATCSVAFAHALGESSDMPVFDARVFVVPPGELNNCLLWRQRDAFKNCVGSVAFYGLAAKTSIGAATRKLHSLSTNQRQEVIFAELGINVNDLSVEQRRGRVIRREQYTARLADTMPSDNFARLLEAGRITPEQTVTRSRLIVDRNIPQFDHDPSYIEDLYGAL